MHSTLSDRAARRPPRALQGGENGSFVAHLTAAAAAGTAASLIRVPTEASAPSGASHVLLLCRRCVASRRVTGGQNREPPATTTDLRISAINLSIRW